MLLERSRTAARAPRAWTCGALVIALIGCTSDPEPTPAPAPEPDPATAPAPEPTTPAPAPSPAPGPAPSTSTSNPPAPAQPAEPRRVVISSRSFSAETLEQVRVDDRVEVELSRGGRTQGVVKNIRANELTLSVDGTQGVITRLRPDDVRNVRVTFRDADRLAGPVTAEGPKSDQEYWLDRWQDRPILDGRPGELWAKRFADNVALPVTRAFTLAAWLPQGRKAGVMTFASGQRAALRDGDKLKIAGTCPGLEVRPGAADRPLAEVTLYLLQRGESYELICSTDPLHFSNLERAAVITWREQEPVTFAALRPDTMRIVRIVRMKGRLCADYVNSLDATPEPSALRAWRAQSNPGLADAERRVRGLFARVGLTGEADLEHPLAFEARVPAVVAGALRLLPFRKELGD